MVIWSHNSGLASGRRGRERPSRFTATSPWTCCLQVSLESRQSVGSYSQTAQHVIEKGLQVDAWHWWVNAERGAKNGWAQSHAAHGCRARRLFCWSKGVSCEKTVCTWPSSGGKSMSRKHTVFHLHHSFFLTSLITHQENAWPATPCTKYNSA